MPWRCGICSSVNASAGEDSLAGPNFECQRCLTFVTHWWDEVPTPSPALSYRFNFDASAPSYYSAFKTAEAKPVEPPKPGITSYGVIEIDPMSSSDPKVPARFKLSYFASEGITPGMLKRMALEWARDQIETELNGPTEDSERSVPDVPQVSQSNVGTAGSTDSLRTSTAGSLGSTVPLQPGEIREVSSNFWDVPRRWT